MTPQKMMPLLLLMAVLAGCAMPETRIYTLDLAALQRGAAEGRDASAVVIVTSPRHLSQPYISARPSPNQLEISRYARWSAPPEDLVGAALKDSLAPSVFREVRKSGVRRNGSYVLQITLRKFERLDEGDSSFAEVAFDAALLSPDGTPLYRDSFDKKVKLADRSFTSLARGVSIALGEQTEAIRGGITEKIGR